MAVLQYADIDDAVIAAQRNLGRGKFTDAMSTLQRYEAFNTLMRSSYVETTQEYGQQWNLLTENNDSAKHVGLYGQDDTDVVDGLQTARIDMRHTTAHWSYDQREIDLNVRNPEAKILNLVKVGRAQCYSALAELMEVDFWTLPATTDTTSPVGVPYYIVRNASDGFNGGNPGSYTTCANVDSDVYTSWKNWSGRYVLYTDEDLLAELEEACVKTQWTPPIDINDYNTGNTIGLYTNYTVYKAMMKLMRDQNDNLGRDLGWNSMKLTFRGTKVTWVPYLENVTTNPVYGINWGDFKILIDEKWWMKEDAPAVAPGQHTVRNVFVDNTWNLKCTNRRKQFVVDIA